MRAFDYLIVAGGAAGCVPVVRLRMSAGVYVYMSSVYMRTATSCTDEVVLPAAGGQR